MASRLLVKMPRMGAKPRESSGRVDRVTGGARFGTMEKLKWVWSEPSLEEADNLARWYSEVVELPVDEVDGETKLWLVKGLLAKSLDRRVMAEVATQEFH